jgi:hypothetical protein
MEINLHLLLPSVTVKIDPNVEETDNYEDEGAEEDEKEEGDEEEEEEEPVSGACYLLP